MTNTYLFLVLELQLVEITEKVTENHDHVAYKHTLPPQDGSVK